MVEKQYILKPPTDDRHMVRCWPPTKAALENCLTGEASFMWGSKAANHQSSFMTPPSFGIFNTSMVFMVSSLNDRIPLNPIQQSLNPTEIPCKYHITPPFPLWNWGRVAPLLPGRRCSIPSACLPGYPVGWRHPREGCLLQSCEELNRFTLGCNHQKNTKKILKSGISHGIFLMD